MRLLCAMARAAGSDASREAFVLVGIPALVVACNAFFLVYIAYRIMHG